MHVESRFELSVNLARILEFLTLELSQVFLISSEMNLTRLCESLVFLLNHTTCGPEARLFERCVCQGKLLRPQAASFADSEFACRFVLHASGGAASCLAMRLLVGTRFHVLQ